MSRPLQFDWSRATMPLGDKLVGVYRTLPDDSYMLYALNKGGGWRWGIILRDTSTPIHESTSPTLGASKAAAELWYLEHGGKPTQQTLPIPAADSEEWEEIPF